MFVLGSKKFIGVITPILLVCQNDLGKNLESPSCIRTVVFFQVQPQFVEEKRMKSLVDNFERPVFMAEHASDCVGAVLVLKEALAVFGAVLLRFRQVCLLHFFATVGKLALPFVSALTLFNPVLAHFGLVLGFFFNGWSGRF